MRDPQPAFAVTRSFTRAFFLEGAHDSKEVPVLGLPRSPSIRERAVGVLVRPPARLGNLPIGSDGVLDDERIGRQQDTVVFKSLANEHAIKWVSMKSW